MLKFSLFPALAVVLCAASLFSCSSNSTDDPSSSSVVPSSNSTGGSSSSVTVSSSSVNVSNPSSSSRSTNVSSSSIAVSSSSNNSGSFKKSITLSNTGNSYADIDGNVTGYEKADVDASKLNKIDLVAHCEAGRNWCEHNSIYTPAVIGLFLGDENFLNGASISFLEIPSAQAEAFKAATTLSEAVSVYNTLTDIFNDEDNYLDEIPIVAGNAFFVITSESKFCVVIIKAASAQSVDLEIIQIT